MMSKEMKNNVAYVVQEMNRIVEQCPGKKSLQKMIYLIQAEGVDLNYEYGIHFYGPYCAAVDTETLRLSADNVIRFDYSNGYTHQMSINPEYQVAPTLEKAEKEKLLKTIEKYKEKSPSALELLTTTHYVYQNIDDKSRESVVGGVQKIKGAKYSVDAILKAQQELGLN